MVKDKKKLIVFDLDHTLLKKNSSFCFYFYLYKKGFFSIKTIAPALFYFISFRFFSFPLKLLHHKIFEKFLKGRCFDNLSRYADAFWEKNFERLINPRILKRLVQAKENGDTVLILSSSPAFLIAPLAKKLGIEEFKGSEYEIDLNNKFLKILSIVRGDNKAKYVSFVSKKWGLTQVVAYSDCISDLPLLEVADEAICVGPKKNLKAYCQINNWEIIK